MAVRAVLVGFLVFMALGGALSAVTVSDLGQWQEAVRPSNLLLVEEGLQSQVAQLLEGPGQHLEVETRVVSSEKLGPMIRERTPRAVVAYADSMEAVDPGSTQVGSISPWLRLSQQYVVGGSSRQPRLFLSRFPGPEPPDLDLSSAMSVLTGHGELPEPWTLVYTEPPEDGFRLDRYEVALGGMDDRRPHFQAWKIDGVLPLASTLQSGEYELAPQVVVLDLDVSIGGAARRIGRWFLDARGIAPRGPLSPYLVGGEAEAVWKGDDSEVRISAVGDLVFDARTGRRIQEHGIEYPFALIRDRLAQSDLTVANLESPIGVKGEPLPGKGIWYRADPKTAQCLVDGEIDIVTIANNHIMDYDHENFLETIGILVEAGVHHIGGGRNIQEAREPLILEKSGITLAFLAYSEFAHLFWSWSYPRSFEATKDLPGVAPLREDVFHLIERDIEKAGEMADVVIVYYHWGEEYVHYPSDQQIDWGRRTVEAGANIVLGTHPHSLKGLEVWQGGLIAYSLGNFVLQDRSRPVTSESVVLEMTVGPEGLRHFNLVPVRITEDRPVMAEGEDRRYLMEKLIGLSEYLEGR